MSGGPPSRPRPSSPPRSARKPRPRWLVALAWIVPTLALFGLALHAYRTFVLLHPDPTLSWVREGITFELLAPRWLGLGLVFPWFVAVTARSLADLPWIQRALAIVLRTAFFALLGLGLSRLARTATTEKVATVIVVDVSSSVSDDALADAQAFVDGALRDKPSDGVVKVVTFAKRPRLMVPTDDGRVVVARHVPASGEVPRLGSPGDLGAGSNAQAGLQLAYGLYPSGYLKRAIVISDGAQTDGDLLAEATRAKELGVRVSTIASDRPAPSELAARPLELPARVKVGETFEIVAPVYATRAMRVKARLYQGEALNGLDGVRELDVPAGESKIAWKSVVRYAGPVTYALELEPLGEDRFAENNRVSATIDVPGRPMVLYVEGTPERAQPLSGALTAQQFDVEVRPAIAFPGSLKELERYDFLVVSDVAREALGTAPQELIERYVRDLGGGFLFAGGENGFGLGGWYRTPLEKILPVRMENEKKKEMPSVAMALVIDRSGSMTGLPMEMAKAAAKATVETLSPDDLVEVIAFDSSPTRYVKLQPARNRTRIAGDIARIQPGGGTEIFAALDAAYQDLTVAQARRKHVILLTDGRAPAGGIKDLVSAMVAESITITTVGLGSELDEPLLRSISDAGGGRFHAVPDANNLPKVFTKETEMIARAAAVEEWFPVTQTGAAAFLEGVDVRTAPYLHGYVSTQLKPAPAQQLLASDTGEPILARWRVGLGWTLAWTPDLKTRWSVEWIRWPGFERFWGQLVREHMRQKHQRELDMKTELAGGVLRASVDAFTPDERFENGLASKLSITGPEPKGDTTTLDLAQVAPGRYEAQTPLDRYGSFLLKAEHFRDQPDGSRKLVAVSYGHLSNPYPPELATFEPNRALLERVATAGGGVVDPKGLAAVLDPAGEKVTYREELWSRFVLAAIAVFVLDLLVRRVRLFDRKFVAAARRA